MSVAGGVRNGDYTDGTEGTAVYIVNTAGQKTLTVAGTPGNFGVAEPDFGVHVYAQGELIRATPPENAFVDTKHRTRRTCVGHALIDDDTGETIETVTDPGLAEFTMDGNRTLVWDLSRLQHQLVVSTVGEGRVTRSGADADDERWDDDGTTVELTPVPAAGERFAGWIGDIAAADQYQTVADFALTAPSALTAVFVSAGTEAVTFTGTGDGTRWLDPANWSTGRLPGPGSAVTIPKGVSVAADRGFVYAVGSLVIEEGATLTMTPSGSFNTLTLDAHGQTFSDLAEFHTIMLRTVGGLTVAGTLSLGRANAVPNAAIEVGGAMDVKPGALVKLRGGFNFNTTTSSSAHWREYGASVTVAGLLTVGGRLTLLGEGVSGSPVLVRADALQVEQGGTLDSDGGGWTWATYTDGGTFSGGPGGVHGNNYSGGAYGGFGGGHTQTGAANTRTYGNALCPYMPGAVGGNNGGANRGGGALRIDVAGRLTVGGTISSNGLWGNGSNGGGSGGSIFVTCGSFRMTDSSAKVAADGHAVSSGENGGGGGGRVLIAQRLTAAQVDALYETGTLPARPKARVVELTDDNVGDYVPGKITAKGGVNSSQADKSGTDGSVRWLEVPVRGSLVIVR